MMSVQEILARRDVKSALANWGFKNENLLKQTAKMFTRYPSYLPWLMKCDFFTEESFSEFATELADMVNNHHQWLKDIPGGVMSYTTGEDMEMLKAYFKVFKHYEELKKLSLLLVKKQSNLLLDQPFMRNLDEIIEVISNTTMGVMNKNRYSTITNTSIIGIMGIVAPSNNQNQRLGM